MSRCLCEYCLTLAAYVATILVAPGVLAIVLSMIGRRNDIKRMHRMRRATWP